MEDEDDDGDGDDVVASCRHRIRGILSSSCPRRHASPSVRVHLVAGQKSLVIDVIITRLFGCDRTVVDFCTNLREKSASRNFCRNGKV